MFWLTNYLFSKNYLRASVKHTSVFLLNFSRLKPLGFASMLKDKC